MGSCLLAASLLAGCASTKQASPVAGVELPSLQPAEAQMVAHHCSALPSPQARTLLHQLAGQNLQVQAAWARVRRAQAQAEQRAAERLPSLRLSVQGSRSKSHPPQFGAFPSGDAFIVEQYEASVAAEYEVDLWNRLGNAVEAARWQARAQRMDAHAMAVSLSAQLLESWFDLSFQLQQRALIETQAETSRKLLTLLKQRFLQGAGPALDALQQKQQMQSLQSALAANLAEIALHRNQLAVLLGREPEAELAVVPDELPPLQSFDRSYSLSASALGQRPDLRSAFYLLRAADAQLASALAQRLPGVRLSGAIFNQSANLSNLVDGLLWRLVGTLTQSLYAGGRISAQIDEAEAALDAQFFQYRQALLTGLQELSGAWIAEEREATRIANLIEQKDIAEKSYRLARQQYLRGAIDYLRVLNALQSMIELQQELLRAQRQRISFRIQFCRALGVDWIGSSQPPDAPVS